MPTETPLTDAHGRRIEYLRVSVTDRCNLRCVYCTSADPSRYLDQKELLTDGEIERIVRVAAGMGVRKVRLTGGEPLARPGIVNLVAALAALPGLKDLSLTTNGLFLEDMAAELKAAGLRRINISLDTLRPDRFQKICQAGGIDTVLRGIGAALRAGLLPVKINVVVVRGTNEDEMRDIIAFAANDGLLVRFIEYMPIRKDAEWGDQFFPRSAMLETLRPLLADTTPAANTSEPAQYFPLTGGGTVGLISPVTHGFCERCNRLRLTAEGTLQTCLLASHQVDLRGPMRDGAADAHLARIIRDAVRLKGQRGNFDDAARPMRRIGG